MADPKGKRVLITGGASGIGLCTAEEFAKAGAEVIITDINQSALDEAAADLRATGATVHARCCDVSNRDEVEKLAAWVVDDLGGLDILINNAGIGHNGELAETSLDTWKKLIDVNLMGPLYHVYAFLPHMQQRGMGHIVNVSSGQAFFRLPTWGAYTTVKIALGVFSEILHFEVKKRNIKVTTVYPFMVNTGFYEGVQGETLGAKLSMKLLPLYSNKPETVGKIIFRAVRREKRVEMVNVLNDLGNLARAVPLVPGAISTLSNWLLAKKEGGVAA
jgi:NAD(P)-dependent dehydrogenase (short-subunit alcohol dehydrogenase family)